LIVTELENDMARPTNKMRPIHPGELLREDMEELGLSARALAEAIAVPHNRIAAILRGERSITADTALRLAVYFGTGADVWMNLQQDYDLKKAELESGAAIRAEIKRRVA
jgi:addiction module HigA family antidote